jgi:hypothetical protein
MMTSDPMRPQGHPEDHDPGSDSHADSPDPAQTLELLQALARKQQLQPAPPESARSGESPLDELARLIGHKNQTASEAEPADYALPDHVFADPAPPEPYASEPPPPRRPRRRRSWALLPNRRTTLAIVGLLVVAVAAAGGVSVWLNREAAVAPEASSADVLAKAMEECDSEAAKNPETLNFLVIPMTPGAKAGPQWSSLTLQQAGDSYLLLSSKDALGGLRDGSLVPYGGQYAFSIVEPATGTRHSWPATTGPTKFAEPDAGSLSSIKLGFAFGDVNSDPKLSSEFLRQKGNCYWVSVLVRK